MKKVTLRDRLKSVLSMGESPRKLALAFAVGVLIAFTPLFGVHTLMAVASSWMFRLNPMALFAGAFITNPWTFVPIYGACLWLGIQLWPPAQGLPSLHIADVSFSAFLTQLKPYLMPLLVGTSVAGIVCAVIGYVVVLRLVRNYRASAGQRETAAD